MKLKKKISAVSFKSDKKNQKTLFDKMLVYCS